MEKSTKIVDLVDDDHIITKNDFQKDFISCDGHQINLDWNNILICGQSNSGKT